MMDLQTVLISVVVFVILALLIWLITSLTVRERPFEERLEEQRKMEKALMLVGSKQGSAKKDKPKKKNKKLKGAERDGTEVSGDKVENVAKTKTDKMVELEIDPTEIIETSLSEPPVNITEKKVKSGKPGSPTKVKPILVNKEEKSNVQKTEQATEFRHRRVRKDEVELKHERELRKSDGQIKLAAAAVNGFHSETTDDDLPVVAARSPSEQKSRKVLQELESLSSDSMTRVANVAVRKPVSNDVTVSGTHL